MKKILNTLTRSLIFSIIFSIFSISSAQALSVSSYTADANGVTFTMNVGRMRLQVCTEDIIRVQYTTASSIPAKTSLSISNSWGPSSFDVAEANGIVTITTSRIKAKVNKSNGSITYTDLNENVILSEDSTNSKTLTAATVEGVSTYKVEALFNSPTNEALYGIGQTQDSVMNRKGTTSHMLNGNTWIYIPTLVSNKGYGIFWDNYSTTDFAGNVSSNTKFRFTSECGNQVDYYFFYGPGIDKVIALYRTATGAAPLFPKWAYGLFQSKDKYASQSELINIKNGYRNNNIPLDCIVQDWDYWTPYTWGSHFMDESRYPDPVSLINQMHTANIHTMISIWPEYEYTSNPRKAGDQDNYNALNAIGALFPSGGTHHFYDTFNANARTLVYQQIYDRLLGKYGWDGIWADNTEPQPYPDSINMRSVNTALGKGAFNINAYPLQHAKALYDGWRKVGPNTKRVYVLTRSAYGGQQRYATTMWSGDIDCNFATYAKQIPAGLNFSIAGIPYWTTDIGGYWGHSVNWSTSANNELFTRWFQYGAFCPIFRIHGGGSRELYGNQWSAETKANLLTIDNLRYRLMPYIYSLAWKVTDDGYSIMRPLIFDYQNDTNVFNIKDQFLFGPAFLVNPVTTAGATSRSVYLPAGTWYDFWTGSAVNGGRSTSVSAPLSQIPLFIKAGSIVPMGPAIQYATQSIDPLEIRIYPGQNSSFTLYEDQGDTYNYESGQYATIQFTWNESAQQLTIGARSGSYSGMPVNRTFNIVWVSTNHGNGVNVAAADKVVNYNGSEVVVIGTLPTPTPTPGPQSAYSQIEAENYSSMSGIQTETCNEGGLDVGFIENGDYLVFNSINFGNGAASFQARVASATNGGNIEIRLDSSTGSLIGTCPVAGTGDWQTWTTATCNVSGVSGVHNLYLVFTGESGYLFNINWFKFVPASTPTPTPVGLKGDVNGDGQIDIVDALLIAQYCVGLNPAGFIPENADVDCSGTVDIVDALLIAQYCVGLFSQFPCTTI